MENKKWFSSHGDTISIIIAFVIGVLWLSNGFKDLRFEMHQNIYSLKEDMNLRFSKMEGEMNLRFSKMEKEMNFRFNDIEKDMITIKTSLIMKGIIPSELVSNKNQEQLGL